MEAEASQQPSRGATAATARERRTAAFGPRPRVVDAESGRRTSVRRLLSLSPRRSSVPDARDRVGPDPLSHGASVLQQLPVEPHVKEERVGADVHPGPELELPARQTDPMGLLAEEARLGRLVA